MFLKVLSVCGSVLVIGVTSLLLLIFIRSIIGIFKDEK